MNLKAALLRLLQDIKHTFPVFLLLLFYFVLTGRLFGASCPSRIFLGLFCPGCGLTRAGIALLRLDFPGAFRQNPSIFLWAPYLFYLFVRRYLLQREGMGSMAALIAVCIATWGVFLLRV